MRTDEQIYDVINHTLMTYEYNDKGDESYLDSPREAQVACTSAIVEVLLDIRSALNDIKAAMQDKQRT